jgi:proline iminopeptidase
LPKWTIQEGTVPNIAVRGVSLFVRTMGSGPPIVLMHGGPGLDHTTLLALAPLAIDHQLIFYDHRANGRSSGDATTMTWNNLTADADALRAILGFDEWTVLGHSFGGHVALMYALRYPERVSRLMLMDTAADAAWAARHAPTLLAKRGYRPSTVEAARRFYTGDLPPAKVGLTVMRFLGAYFHDMRLRALPAMIAGAWRMKRRPEAHVVGFRSLLKDWSVMDRLHEIRMPTLVVAGRDDFLFPPESQAILADRLPNAAPLEIIERAGHNPQDENPRAVIEVIRAFLATDRQHAEARHGAPLAETFS